MGDTMERQDETNADANVPAPWRASIPVWRSAVVLRQLLAVLVIAVAVVWLVMVMITAVDGSLDAAALWSFSSVILIVLAVLVGLTALVIALLYRNAEYWYELDEQGISATTVGGTRRKNAVINTLLLVSGRPSTMGAGAVAAARQDERVRWSGVDSYTVHERRRQIVLRRRRRPVMRMQCTAENLHEVVSFIAARVARRD